MKPIRPYSAVAALCVILFALAPNMCAQESTPPRHTGVPQDWSQHHIVFSRDGLARHPDLIDREPRIRFQEMQRSQGPNSGVLHGAGAMPASVNKSGLHRDWNINLAGRLNPDTFPAKFSFDPSAPPDCVNDYVVFAMARVETADTTGTTANLVAFNNLYSDPVNGGGFCDPATGPFPGPQVLFAYNITTVTGGRIVTSPVLSEDGKKIAFVESIPAGTADTITATSVATNVLTVTASNTNLTVGEVVTIQGTVEDFLNGQSVIVTGLIGTGPTYTGFTANFTTANYTNASDTGTATPPAQAIFHVLTWAANAVGSRGVLGPGGAVLPVSMTSVPLVAPGPTTANDTTSSPWVDYGADTAYVGADNGVVYQIVGVFRSASTLSGSPWPVSLTPNVHLTSPVLDGRLRLLMVGSLTGTLYQININSPASLPKQLSVGDTAGGATTPGIVAPPIVDITNGTTFAVTPYGIDSAELVQADTATLGTHVLQIANIGIGSTTGTHFKLYEPAFSNNYYNSPSTGVITLCGTSGSDTSPEQYAFGFTGTTMITSPPVVARHLSASLTDRCSGWTEFYNPNVGAADAITATSVASDVLTVTASNNNLAVGEEVYLQGTAEASLNGHTVTVTSLTGSAPMYTGFTASFTTADYSNPSDTGTVAVADTITATSVASNVLTVTASNSNLTVGGQVYIQGTAEPFLNGHTVTVASLIGSSGFTANFTATNYTNATDSGIVSAVPTAIDFFFFSLTGDCTLLPGGTGVTTGCVVSLANNGSTTTTTIAPVKGGASGIIVDNYSSAAQASSIYFTAGSVNTAYKFTQGSLQ